MRVLEIHNKDLFYQVVQSMHESDVTQRCKTINLFDDRNKKLNEKNMLIITDIPSFELSNKRFTQTAIDRLAHELQNEPDILIRIETGLKQIVQNLQSILLEFNGTYLFNEEWNLVKFIKSQELRLDDEIYSNALEKCLSILDYMRDQTSEVILVLINLKIWLTESQLEEFYRAVVSKKIYVLLIEVIQAETIYLYEKKLQIDVDFVELLI